MHGIVLFLAEVLTFVTRADMRSETITSAATNWLGRNQNHVFQTHSLGTPWRVTFVPSKYLPHFKLSGLASKIPKFQIWSPTSVPRWKTEYGTGQIQRCTLLQYKWKWCSMCKPECVYVYEVSLVCACVCVCVHLNLLGMERCLSPVYRLFLLGQN